MNLERSTKPLPTDEINFSLPEIQNFTLENGLEVFFVKKDSLPILRFNLVINAGSKFDPADKKGLANLFTLMLDEGAGDYNALELSDEFDILGSHFGVRSDHDTIYLSLQTLKENLNRSLELLGLVVTKPKFDDEDFEREKRKVLTHLLQLHDDPESIANSVFDFLVFGEENPYAYSADGYESTLKNVTNEDIKQFYQQYFIPKNAALVVVGASSENELKSDFK